MALVTKVIVRLMRQPEVVKTMLAIYDSRGRCGATVAEITRRAITPVAVEMLDGVMLRMVEEATHAGYPMDAAAVLLIELEGLTEAVEEQVEQIRDACFACSATRIPCREIGRGARPALEGPQECVRGGRAREPVLLRAGRSRAAHADRSHAAAHRRGRGEVRPDDQQHLPCGRRQHASDHSVQRAQARRSRKGADRRAKKFSPIASQSAGRLRASMASAWRRRN